MDYLQFKEMLKEALQNNLSIQVDPDTWNSKYKNIKIYFDETLITTDSIYIE